MQLIVASLCVLIDGLSDSIMCILVVGVASEISPRTSTKLGESFDLGLVESTE